MELADDIRRRGFKKWYERQLIESHAYLVTCVLCMILVAALMEELTFRSPRAFVMIAIAGGSGLLGLVSWLRYRRIMLVAERLGDRSVCERCHAYARFDVVESGGAPATPESEPDPWLHVRCRKCGHDWTMP